MTFGESETELSERRRSILRAAGEFLAWAAAAVFVLRLRVLPLSLSTPAGRIGLLVAALLCVPAIYAGIRLVSMWQQYRRGDVDVHAREGASRRFTVDGLTRVRSWSLWSQPGGRLLFLGAAAPCAIIVFSGASIATSGAVGSGIPGVSWFLVAFGLAMPVLVVARQGRLSEVLLSADGTTIMAATGARHVPQGSDPRVRTGLEFACAAVGVVAKPTVYVVESQSVNAFVVGTRTECAVGISQGLRDIMDQDEMTAVLASLLVRLDSGLVATADPAYLGRPSGKPALSTPSVTIDLFAAWDDRVVRATRDPGMLASALKKTRDAEDTTLAGLGPQHSVYLWTAPRLGVYTQTMTLDGLGSVINNPIESRRLALLEPVMGPGHSV